MASDPTQKCCDPVEGERNWSTFALIHTKQRNRLTHSTLDKLVFASYNMKLSLRDEITRYADEIEPLDPLDIIERAFDRPGVGSIWSTWMVLATCPILWAESHARAKVINVEQILSEEVGVDTRDHDSSDSGNDCIYSRLFYFNTYGSNNCV